jgi:hypothetical protein
MSFKKTRVLRTCEGEEPDAARTLETFERTCFWMVRSRLYGGRRAERSYTRRKEK